MEDLLFTKVERAPSVADFAWFGVRLAGLGSMFSRAYAGYPAHHFPARVGSLARLI